jgi:diguanylate cyclase (GGDEF)-like protein
VRLTDLLRQAERGGIFDRRKSGDQDLLEGLVQCMSERKPFRDRTVYVQAGRERRFWSLSAKPVHDSDGNFKGYRGVGTDVTDKTRAERKLAYLAHVDALTNLANRSSLEIHLAEAFRSLRTGGERFSLICLDLDGFKAVNDSYGHAAGDQLLALVGKRLARCVREGDIVARVGGDEFAILQKADDQPKAGLALAQRVVATLASPFNIQGRQVTLGASVGVAQGGRDGSNPMSLLRHADLALYRAKRCGRGRYLLYHPRMAQEAEKAATSISATSSRSQRQVEELECEKVASLVR